MPPFNKGSSKRAGKVWVSERFGPDRIETNHYPTAEAGSDTTHAWQHPPCRDSVRTRGGNWMSTAGGVGPGGRGSRPEGPIPCAGEVHQGHAVGRKRVRRLMAVMGLAPIYQRPR